MSRKFSCIAGEELPKEEVIMHVTTPTDVIKFPCVCSICGHKAYFTKELCLHLKSTKNTAVSEYFEAIEKQRHLRRKIL